MQVADRNLKSSDLSRNASEPISVVDAVCDIVRRLSTQ